MSTAPIAQGPVDVNVRALPPPTVHEDETWRIEYYTAGQMLEYAAHAIASEREACADVCAALRLEWARMKVGATDGRYDMMEEAATVCEDEIRERSNVY